MKTLYTNTLMSILFLAVSSVAYGDDDGRLRFAARLSTAQEVPTPVPGLITDARVKAKFDKAFTRVEVKLKVRGGDNVMAAHFHCARPGKTGPVAFGLFSPGPLVFDGRRAKGTLTNDDFTGADCVSNIGRPVNNIVALALAMRDDKNIWRKAASCDLAYQSEIKHFRRILAHLGYEHLTLNNR